MRDVRGIFVGVLAPIAVGWALWSTTVRKNRASRANADV